MQQLMAKGHGTETQLRQLKQRMADIGGRIGEVIAGRARTESAIEEVQISNVAGNGRVPQVRFLQLWPKPIWMFRT